MSQYNLASTMEFSAIAPSRAVDEIAAQVREMIAAGTLKPGDRLPSERDLSARLHVSRNTLREALRALEDETPVRDGSASGAVCPGCGARGTREDRKGAGKFCTACGARRVA